MSKDLGVIDAALAAWIGAQRLFFVATAPLSADGRINVSPKGGDALRVLGERRVAYQDWTGSGCETIAHLKENGRIVIMLRAFDGPARIVRLHGRGVALLGADPGFAELAAAFPPYGGMRAIIDIALERISSSCGFGVPLYQHLGERDDFERWLARKGPEGLRAYRDAKNQRSIDGLPAIPPGG